MAAVAGGGGARGPANQLREDLRAHLTLARNFAVEVPHHKMMCKAFLDSFEDVRIHCNKYRNKKYMRMLQDVANHQREALVIETQDIDEWCGRQVLRGDVFAAHCGSFIGGISHNVRLYQRMFYDVAKDMLPEHDHGASEDSRVLRKFALSKQMKEDEKRERDRIEKAGGTEVRTKDNMIPDKLKYPFDVRFRETRVGANAIQLPLRMVKSAAIGKLVRFDATVSRVSPVKPKMEIATYVCTLCQCRTFQEIESDEFMPVLNCPSTYCKDNKESGLGEGPSLPQSKFVKYQELKVQELTSEVPVGSIPRCLNILVEGDLTRIGAPGESVTVTGCYIPHVQNVAGKQVTTMFVHAHDIVQHKKGYNEDENSYEYKTLLNHVKQAGKDPHIYEKLAQSIGPQIFGMEDVKKALLLLLVGGVTKKLADGMKVRGDLHVLLMGDPGVAKSQLLKQASQIAPRAVYTSGKGTSGVGLTAAVTRDQQTSEVHLEGGALVLADRGICCIDEFDKMEEADRTAIHEVMEQQTVSIAKAGITTTLNARTSVLAAANPQYGRYDISRSPVENMNLPAALLSRFDLKFLLLDNVEKENDIKLSKFVLETHRYGGCDPKDKKHKGGGGGDDGGGVGLNDDGKYDAKFLRAYLKYAKSFEPLVPRSLEEKIVLRYVDMRKAEREERADTRKDYITPRQLLGMIRLSQALARLKFSNVVDERDWEEAIRLTDASKASVVVDPDAADAAAEREAFARDMQIGENQEADPDEIDENAMRDQMDGIVGAAIDEMGEQQQMGQDGEEGDYMGNIWDILRQEFLKAGQNVPIFVTELKKAVTSRGYNQQQFDTTLGFYEDMGVVEYTDATRNAVKAGGELE